MMLQILRTVTLAAVACLTLFTTQAQTTAREWYEEGQKLYNKKDYEAAAKAYDKASTLDPNYDAAFYKAGWCYNELERYYTAVEKLKSAVAVNKNHAEAWQEMGYAYKKLGQNIEALSSLNTAISVRPLYATAYRQIGDVYQNMKNYPEAIAAYKKCVEIDKSNEAAYYNLGYISNATGEYTNALYWLHKALSLQQKVTTYNEIGFAYYKQKMNDSAIAAYRNALRITPENGTAYKGIGDVYRRNYSPARTDDAIEAYKKAIQYNPKSSGSHFGLGWCYNEKGMYSESVPLLNKALELDNTLVAGYTELGYAQYMTGKNQDALSSFRKGINADNKNVLCRYYSGLVYIQQKDKTNASAMVEQLIPLDSKLADKLRDKISSL